MCSLMKPKVRDPDCFLVQYFGLKFALPMNFSLQYIRHDWITNALSAEIAIFSTEIANVKIL